LANADCQLLDVELRRIGINRQSVKTSAFGSQQLAIENRQFS
jgi:hypothetical protein